jgi:hypothetical protein
MDDGAHTGGRERNNSAPMRGTTPNPCTLSDLPLWQLTVALDDAERIAGADSSTARVLARALQERLAQEHGAPLPFCAEVPHGAR